MLGSLPGVMPFGRREMRLSGLPLLCSKSLLLHLMIPLAVGRMDRPITKVAVPPPSVIARPAVDMREIHVTMTTRLR
jgi:hypothetical protein